MYVRFYKVIPALQHLVEMIMVFENRVNALHPLAHNPFPPSPQQGLFFYLGDPMYRRKHGQTLFEKCPEVMLTGPQLKKVDLQMGSDHYLLYIGFRPGALHKLSRVPMQQLLDEDINASLLFGPSVLQLAEQLKNTGSNEKRVALLQQYLLRKAAAVSAPDPFERVMRLMVTAKGSIPIDKVADYACLSVRQLERRCLDSLGIPPKFFTRLVRFSNAYRLHEAQPSLNWNNIAYSSGYFDQGHLIRDFKEFTGGTPKLLERQLQQTPFRLQALLQIE